MGPEQTSTPTSGPKQDVKTTGALPPKPTRLNQPPSGIIQAPELPETIFQNYIRNSLSFLAKEPLLDREMAVNTIQLVRKQIDKLTPQEVINALRTAGEIGWEVHTEFNRKDSMPSNGKQQTLVPMYSEGQQQVEWQRFYGSNIKDKPWASFFPLELSEAKKTFPDKSRFIFSSFCGIVEFQLGLRESPAKLEMPIPKSDEIGEQKRILHLAFDALEKIFKP